MVEVFNNHSGFARFLWIIFCLFVRHPAGITIMVPADKGMIWVNDNCGLGKRIRKLADSPAGMDEVLVALEVLDGVRMSSDVDRIGLGLFGFMVSGVEQEANGGNNSDVC